MTETEQLDAIKKWWKRYNNIITVVLSIVLLSVAGYKYWHWHQEKMTQQASNAYEHMMLAYSNQDNKSVRGYVNQLTTEYGDTVYADAARLTLAKLLVLRESYDKAEKQLEYVAGHSKNSAFRQISKIRLARLLASLKSFDKALAELDTLENTAYLPEVNEIKGDIYSAKGQYLQAVDFYRKAINQVQTHGMGNLFLEMKTNELAALTKSTRIEVKPSQAA